VTIRGLATFLLVGAAAASACERPTPPARPPAFAAPWVPFLEGKELAVAYDSSRLGRRRDTVDVWFRSHYDRLQHSPRDSNQSLPQRTCTRPCTARPAAHATSACWSDPPQGTASTGTRPRRRRGPPLPITPSPNVCWGGSVLLSGPRGAGEWAAGSGPSEGRGVHLTSRAGTGGRPD